MPSKLSKIKKRIRRHKRCRAKIFGTAIKPRLCVFRSNKHIYAQLIDDEKGKVLLSASDFEVKGQKNKAPSLKIKDKNKNDSKKEDILQSVKRSIAYKVGALIAQKAFAKKIKKIVFDRGGYKYHGRVRALAEGARNEGLEF